MFVDDQIYELLASYFAHGKELAERDKIKLQEWFLRQESMAKNHYGKNYYYTVPRDNILHCYGGALKPCRQAAERYCKSHPGEMVFIYKRLNGQEIPYIKYVGIENGEVRRQRLV